MDRKRPPNSMCENRTLTGRLRADHGRQDKSAAFGRAHVVGRIADFRHLVDPTCWRFRQKHKIFNAASAIPVIGECTLTNDLAGR